MTQTTTASGLVIDELELGGGDTRREGPHGVGALHRLAHRRAQVRLEQDRNDPFVFRSAPAT